MICDPAGDPSARTGLPPCSTRVGDMLLRGRFPAAIAFSSPPVTPNLLGTPGFAEKSSISLFSTKPAPRTTTPEPSQPLIVWVDETTLPSLSAIVKCVVSGDS